MADAPDRVARRALVFAYGSNLDSARMTARVSSAEALGASLLRAHVLRFHKRGSRDGTGKANAFRTGVERDVVHGVVYSVDPAHLEDLDRIEGGYRRRSVPVAMRSRPRGSLVRAWVYVAAPGWIDDSLRPSRWYLDHVLRGAREHELPGELVRELRRIERGLVR